MANLVAPDKNLSDAVDARFPILPNQSTPPYATSSALSLCLRASPLTGGHPSDIERESECRPLHAVRVLPMCCCFTFPQVRIAPVELPLGSSRWSNHLCNSAWAVVVELRLA